MPALKLEEKKTKKQSFFIAFCVVLMHLIITKCKNVTANFQTQAFALERELMLPACGYVSVCIRAWTKMGFVFWSIQ